MPDVPTHVYGIWMVLARPRMQCLLSRIDPEVSLLNKLPGFKRSPAGLEWALLRRLPLFVVAGIVVPLLTLTMLWLAAAWPGEFVPVKLVTSIEIALASLVILYWTIVFTGALACVIVMIAKGPAYVADAYPLPDADAPLP